MAPAAFLQERPAQQACDNHHYMTTVSAESAGIRATGLTKSYGSVQAVRGIDLVIASGETVALLGPNGAGKTTTIDMILGLRHPDAGAVSVCGLPPARAVRSGLVGGMLQTGSLPDHLRVRELISLVASYYPQPLDVEDVLRRTGLSDLAERWTTKLSGGQAQRVRFATALVTNGPSDAAGGRPLVTSRPARRDERRTPR